jgi:hypothetical protein
VIATAVPPRVSIPPCTQTRRAAASLRRGYRNPPARAQHSARSTSNGDRAPDAQRRQERLNAAPAGASLLSGAARLQSARHYARRASRPRGAPCGGPGAAEARSSAAEAPRSRAREAPRNEAVSNAIERQTGRASHSPQPPLARRKARRSLRSQPVSNN